MARKLRQDSNFIMIEGSSTWTIKDLYNICQPEPKIYFLKVVDLYDMNLPSNEVMIKPAMLWHIFPLPITDDMAEMLHQYDYPIQLSPLVVLAYKKIMFLEKTFSIKLCYDEIVSVIEFI